MTSLSMQRSVIGIIRLTLKYIVEMYESVIKYVKGTQVDEGYHKIIEIIDNIIIK